MTEQYLFINAWMTLDKLEGLHILVAEDDELNRSVVTTILEERGVKIHLAHDGAEAISLSMANTYDLILMDIEMPNVNGLEATRAIREWERSSRRRATPILAMTAHSEPNDLRACSESGMDDYIIKPLRLNEFSEKLSFVATQKEIEEGSMTLLAAAPPPPESGININAMIDEVGKEHALRLLKVFANIVTKQLDLIGEALNNGDTETVLMAAHKLIGTSAQYHALGLSSLARRLHTQIKSGSMSEADNSFQALMNEGSQVARRIDKLI